MIIQVDEEANKVLVEMWDIVLKAKGVEAYNAVATMAQAVEIIEVQSDGGGDVTSEA